MFKTFNCGIGLMLVVANEQASNTVDLLNDAGEQAWHVGSIASADTDQPFVALND